MFFYFLRAHSGLCNRKKRKKQAFLNIKNGETISFYKKIFFLEISTASNPPHPLYSPKAVEQF